MSRFSLENKNVLITGASSGIGASCAIACSESGANLILLGRDQKKLNQILKLTKNGNNSIISYDLQSLSGIEQALEEFLNKYQKIHGFIHSAGIDITLPLNSLRYKDFNSVFTTNIISGFEIARIISKKQFCQPSGASYIYIASVLGLFGKPGTIAYSSSKGALIAGCRSMALELAEKKIRVNCISPGIVKTELVGNLIVELPTGALDKIKSQYPLGFGSPVDVANTCVFLLSDEAKWITGSNLVVDGGYSCQ
jgi:NAD(P)-dependent dehydrogenase (short-subunit alcohol dehydrogenase family)